MSDYNERTRPHRRVETILSKMGVGFVSETTEFPPYKLDIYLPDEHLCIEIDGPQHLRKHDKVRDEWLRQRFGIETLRIKLGNRWLSNDTMEKKIELFLDEWSDSSKERKMIWRQILL